MTTYSTTIETGLDHRAAFAYLSDFSSTREWDPSVTSADRLDDGAVAVGSRFLVVSKVGPSSVPLTYVVTAFELDHWIVLRAETARLVSVDTITFEAASGGSAVTYHADLALRGAWRVLDPLLAIVFRRTADRASARLRVVLEQRSSSAA